MTEFTQPEPGDPEYLREKQVERRREFWRTVAGLEEIGDSHPEYERYHVHLELAVSHWMLELDAPLKNAVEDHVVLKSLWEDVDLAGHATGLRSASDALMKDAADDPEPLDFLYSAGIALNNAAILLFDLPRRPPVVEQPWNPSERERADSSLGDDVETISLPDECDVPQARLIPWNMDWADYVVVPVGTDGEELSDSAITLEFREEVQHRVEGVLQFGWPGLDDIPEV